MEINDNHTLTMASLFDGIGGFPLAAVRNGIVPIWASEIEPFPIRVTEHHFPDMVHLGDITKLSFRRWISSVEAHPAKICPWRVLRAVAWLVSVPACLCTRSGSSRR